MLSPPPLLCAELLILPNQKVAFRIAFTTLAQTVRTTIAFRAACSNGRASHLLCAAFDALDSDEHPSIDHLQFVASLAHSCFASHGHSCHISADLPHATTLRTLLDKFESHDYYHTALIGLALLERSLHALVALACVCAARRPPAGPQLLKDLIESPELKQAFGAGATATLSAFFSPKMVNARNLVWHGFLRPTELDQRYVALILLLCIRADEALHEHVLATMAPREDGRDSAAAAAAAAAAVYPIPLWNFSEADEVLQDARSLLEASMGGFISIGPPPDGCCAICLTSPLSRPDLAGHFSRRSLPCIGATPLTLSCFRCQSLRLAFAKHSSPANPGEEALGFACVGQYFSTLDGYGQRSKHQLLLDYTLHSTGEPNGLVSRLGRGLHGLLLDLFMHAAGPSLRAKFAHGEAGLVQSEEKTKCSAASATTAALPLVVQLAYAALLCLCFTAHDKRSIELLTELEGERLVEVRALVGRVAAHTSVCDPLVRLSALRRRVQAAIDEALVDGAAYAVDVDNGECTIPGTSATVAVGVTVRESDRDAIQRVETLGRRVETALMAARSKVEGASLDRHPGAPASSSAPELGTQVECSRWGLLRCSQLFCELERGRLAHLAGRVLRREASTGQRRSFFFACLGTLATRRLVALAVALSDHTPMRPPLPKLHALVEGLCAAHEGGKGIDHTTTLGLRFLDRC